MVVVPGASDAKANADKVVQQQMRAESLPAIFIACGVGGAVASRRVSARLGYWIVLGSLRRALWQNVSSAPWLASYRCTPFYDPM